MQNDRTPVKGLPTEEEEAVHATSKHPTEDEGKGTLCSSEPYWPRWRMLIKKNFLMMLPNGVLIRRAGLTSVSPSLDIYSVTTAIVSSNKLSIPIRISNAEVKNVKPLGLIDSGAGGKFIDENYAKAIRLRIKTLETPL